MSYKSSKNLKDCRTGAILFTVFLFLQYSFILKTFIQLIRRARFYYEQDLGFSINHFDYFIFGAAIILFLIFFLINLIICVRNSTQISLKLRINLYIFGFFPGINLPFIIHLIKVLLDEYNFETAKNQLNESRKAEQICKTKYPFLMVHGVFFRDSDNFNYWGRIPGELEKNGAKIFYGNNQSSASVEEAGQEIATRIKEILSETGAEKVNIIAHSKGGLDSRYAISCLGMAPYVASLTTINTPHHGTHFSEHYLEKFSNRKKNFVARVYNHIFHKVGDPSPDFLGGVSDLGAERVEELNKIMPDMEEVYYQSTGSKMNRASSGQFPLWFTYNLVKKYDGENDGLVGEGSYIWGDKTTFLSTNCRRGISHGDMIDLNRRNLKAFDVREFYVQMVSELRKKGF